MAAPSIFTMTPLSLSLPTTLLRRKAVEQCCNQLRYKSTTRRMTKALRLHPHASFIGTASTLPSQASAARSLEQAGVQSTILPTIVHNPPSAAPTPFITPKLFLPPKDPRYSPPAASAILTSAPVLSTEPIDPRPTTETGERLAPALNRPYQKTYHLTEVEIKKIQRLRGQNPDVYSRRKLARMFGCSEFFVGMVAPTTEERKEAMKGRLQGVKDKWGKIRRFAREERGRRRDLWSRDL